MTRRRLTDERVAAHLAPRLDELADSRADEERRRGLPTTVDEAVARIVANTHRGTPRKSWEAMTPSRYVLAADLVRAGADPAMVVEAVDRIHASGWLQRPVVGLTAADLARAAELAAEAAGPHF